MKKKCLLLLFLFLSLTIVAQVGNSSGDSINTQSPLGGCPPSFFVFQEPNDYSACSGTNVLFTAYVSSARTKYWERSTDGGITWTMVPGTYVSAPIFPIHSEDSLLIVNTTPAMNNYKYRCYYALDCFQPIYTRIATLTINNTTTINTQPADAINICSGLPVDFTASVTGGSLGFLWQISTDGGITFSDIAGATAATLHFNSVNIGMNNNKYRCIITSNCYATVISNIATLTVSNDIPVINSHPPSATGCVGNSVSFTASVSGSNVNYQWQYKINLNGSIYTDYMDIPGETASTLDLTNLTYSFNKRRYRCRIGGSCSYIYTNEATLRVYPEPIISVQPINHQATCLGYQVNLNTYAYDTFYHYNVFHQWQKSIDSGLTFSDISGATDYAYNYTVTASNVNYFYRCKVYNPCFTKYTDTVSIVTSVPISIITQPSNISACEGYPVSFSTIASGSLAANHHQWQLSTDGGINFSDLGSASSSNILSIGQVSFTMNNNKYRCKILSNCVSPVYSDIVTLTVNPKPNLGKDTAVNVSCQFCTANLITLYNTSNYNTVNWNTPDPVNAISGKYSLIIGDSNTCADTAVASVNYVSGSIIRACKGSRIGRITSDVTGPSYQWSMDYLGNSNWSTLYAANGSGPITTPYINPEDINPSQGSYGTRYRCYIAGVGYSSVFVIKYTSLWIGNVDNNWNNPANWSCGAVPDAQTDVIINSGTVIVTANTPVRTLKLNPGVNFSVAPGVTLTILY